MKKHILWLTLALSALSLNAQNKEKATELIAEGITLHDNGHYKEAIKKYRAAVQEDKDNVIAKAEISLSQLAMKDYKACIKTCQNTLKEHPDAPDLAVVYTNYANALDESGKSKKAIEIYDEGIKKMPGFYQLHFNKGIALIQMEKYNEGLLELQNAIELNPNHAGSHNAIGRVVFFDNKIPALMALSRFMALEPQGARAKFNFDLMMKILQTNVEKTGENSINITVDEKSLNSASEGANKENDFGTTELIMQLVAANNMGEESEGLTEREKFLETLKTLSASLKEQQSKNSGFYWEYYVPYFIAMKDQDQLDTFSYIVFANQEDPKVMEWLSNHVDRTKAFFDWSDQYTW